MKIISVLVLLGVLGISQSAVARDGTMGGKTVPPSTSLQKYKSYVPTITQGLSCQALHPAIADLDGVLSDPYCCVRRNPEITNAEDLLTGAAPQYDNRPPDTAERRECLQKSIETVVKLSGFLNVQILTVMRVPSEPTNPSDILAGAADIAALEESLTNRIDEYSRFLAAFRDKANRLMTGEGSR